MFSKIEGSGPIHFAPAAATALANDAASDKNPYPGCTASAPDFLITSTSASIFK